MGVRGGTAGGEDVQVPSVKDSRIPGLGCQGEKEEEGEKEKKEKGEEVIG